jgi:hypothetical protein
MESDLVHLNLYNRAKWVVNFTIPLLHLRGNGSRYPLDRRQDGFQKRFGSCGSGRPARSQTVYWLVLPAVRQWGSCWGYVICSELVNSDCCSDSQPLTTRRSVPVGIHPLPAAQPSDYHPDISSYIIYLRLPQQCTNSTTSGMWYCLRGTCCYKEPSKKQIRSLDRRPQIINGLHVREATEVELQPNNWLLPEQVIETSHPLPEKHKKFTS